MRATRDARRTAGFTYLWLLMVIAFVALTTSMAIDLDKVRQQRDKEEELTFIGQQFQAAFARYSEVRAPVLSGSAADGSTQPPLRVPGSATPDLRMFPRSLDELLEDRRVDPPIRHLRRIYTDPMTGKPDWGLLQVHGRIIAVHSKSDLIPLKTSGFDPEWESFTNASTYAGWIFATAQARQFMKPQP